MFFGKKDKAEYLLVYITLFLNFISGTLLIMDRLGSSVQFSFFRNASHERLGGALV